MNQLARHGKTSPSAWQPKAFGLISLAADKQINHLAQLAKPFLKKPVV
ncbi:MAG: hypothetical protein WCL19_07620 [Verrucomicrobiota bacterium]